MSKELQLVFKTRTESECLNFLKFSYNNDWYLPNELFSFVSENKLDLNKVLSKSIISYSGNEHSYNDYSNTFIKKGEVIKQSTIYMNELSKDMSAYSNPQKILCYKFFEKIEDSLSNARMNISMVLNILPVNYELPYIVTYDKRCLDFENACMNIYSCYDYVLVLINFYYKYSDLISGKTSFDELLLSSRKNGVSKLLTSEPIDKTKTNLKNIIDKLEIKTTKVRDWANSIKHRCGLEYYALKPKTPFRFIININGKNVETTNLFKLPLVDIDNDVQTLLDAYNVTYNSIIELYNNLHF